MSARGSNAECENMMAEHEEVLATEFVVTTRRQDTTELVTTMLEDIMTTKLVLIIDFHSELMN